VRCAPHATQAARGAEQTNQLTERMRLDLAWLAGKLGMTPDELAAKLGPDAVAPVGEFRMDAGELAGKLGMTVDELAATLDRTPAELAARPRLNIVELAAALGTEPTALARTLGKPLPRRVLPSAEQLAAALDMDVTELGRQARHGRRRPDRPAADGRGHPGRDPGGGPSSCCSTRTPPPPRTTRDCGCGWPACGPGSWSC